MDGLPRDLFHECFHYIHSALYVYLMVRCSNTLYDHHCPFSSCTLAVYAMLL